MTTLVKECEKHTPHNEAISYYVSNLIDLGTEFTFCENCEQDISRFCYDDDERGLRWSNWSVTK